MRPIIIFIALCLIRKTHQRVESYGSHTALLEQTLCINVALDTYLKDYRNIWLFSTNPSDVLHSLFKVPLFVISEWDRLQEALFLEIGTMIIFLEGNAEQDFNGLKRLLKIVNVEPVLVVCVADVICSSEMYKKKIIELTVAVKLHYIAVEEGGIIAIYEYTTTVAGNCGIGQLLRRGHCSDESTAKRVFQTFDNFDKCPIYVTTWLSPPFSELCSNDYSPNQLCGIAGKVVDIITAKINATPVLTEVGTPQDVRQRVANKHADLGFGELDDRRFEGVSYSIPYMFVQATVVAPHSTWVLNRSLWNMFEPFEKEVWMGIGVAIVSIFVLSRLISNFRKMYGIQLFGVFLGIPVSRQPRGLPIRIYFLSLVLFGYICSQSYLTNLTKVLSSHRHEIIETLNDLDKSTLRVFGTAAMRDHFKDEYPRIYRDFQVNEDAVYYSTLELLLQGYSTSVYYVEDLDTNIAGWKNVKPLRDRLNWYSIVLAASNTSTLLQTSNKILSAIWESGISAVHQTFEPTMYQSSDKRKNTSSGKTVVLEFDDLKGVFLLLIIGLVLCTFVFMIEIATAFIKKKLEPNGESKIPPEWSRRRQVHGILLPKQRSNLRGH